jgi:hypothetical protein
VQSRLDAKKNTARRPGGLEFEQREKKEMVDLGGRFGRKKRWMLLTTMWL